MGVTDLLILGLVTERPRHGYEINREIESRGYRQWVKVSDVAIYKALARLERNGFLLSLAEKDGKNPEKVVYSLSGSGRERLSDLLYDQLSSQEPIRNGYFLCFEFLGALDDNELSVALEKRVESVRKHLAGRKSRLELIDGLEDDLVVETCRHEVEVYELELSWLKSMLTRVPHKKNQPLT